MRAALLGVALLGGCATLPTEAERIANALPAVTVQARGETAAVATVNRDAADDPAIWRNPGDPAESLIIGTDKRAGLHVYDLAGVERSFLDAGAVNNVDVRDLGEGGIIVAASDRNDLLNAHVALFRLDPTTAMLRALVRVPAGKGEAYGLCLARGDGFLHAFVVMKSGEVRQIELEPGASGIGRILRSFKLDSQSEGCVVDDRTRRLYVVEEAAGLWRFDARPDAAATPVKIGALDGKQLVADAEGVALAPSGATGGQLIVSSQGDNAYTVYDLATERYVGRFRIAQGALGSTEETDGIEVALGDFGPGFPGGLFIAQDGRNQPRAQNFKLVAWDDIKRALNLN